MSNANGGPPGTKKVKAQLAQLVASASIPDAGPVQAVAVKEGVPEKPSSKKMLRWAIGKYGADAVEERAKACGMTPKRWARMVYNEMIEQPEVVLANPLSQDDPLSSKDLGKLNDAMKALETGAEKRSTKKRKEAEPVSVIDALKASGTELAKNALEAFLEGPVRAMMVAFVTLYVSRKTDGDSDEAVLALESCRVTFDACGLILGDVETKSTKPKAVKSAATPEAAASYALPDAASTMPQKPHGHGVAIETAKERKNRLDRERRAAKKVQQTKK